MEHETDPKLFCNDNSKQFGEPKMLISTKMHTHFDQNDQNTIAHIETHISSMRCDVCDSLLSDAYNLRIHKMQHTNEFRYDCPECGKKFRQRNKMQKHRVIHTTMKPHVCDVCGKGYRFRDYLIIHRRLHESPDIKPYKCKLCTATFHSLHLRRTHVQKDHNEENNLIQQYVCPVALCSKKFSNNCHLITHMKRHTESRQYKCEYCKKSFYDQSHLRSHQTTHINLKSFSCDVCPARFRRKFNLQQHKMIHLPMKTYVCTKCNRGFAQKAGLSIHQRKNVCSKGLLKSF